MKKLRTQSEKKHHTSHRNQKPKKQTKKIQGNQQKLEVSGKETVKIRRPKKLKKKNQPN